MIWILQQQQLLPGNCEKILVFALLDQVPVRIPPGMPADQAAGIIEYLKANPEAAKAAWGQAQAIMQNPGLANAFVNMQVRERFCCQGFMSITMSAAELIWLTSIPVDGSSCMQVLLVMSRVERWRPTWFCACKQHLGRMEFG